MVKNCLNCGRKVKCTMNLKICKTKSWIRDYELEEILKTIDNYNNQ